MNMNFHFPKLNQLWSARLRRAVFLSSVVGTLGLVGCAHPISIDSQKLPVRGAQTSTKKAAYVMSEADRKIEVTTQGGGGDKISYFPYKDFERALRSALAAVYSDVSVVASVTDLTAIRETGATFVFKPEISTTSSSSSALTWPPTKFSVSVLVDVMDAKGAMVARLRVTGNGAAEWEEFKGDFALAGRRAVEDASRALVEEIKKTEVLR